MYFFFSASHDCSCRLWTLGGRYLGTLGTPLPWKRISPFETVDEHKPYRLPPDIKKIASSTTLKVISGVYFDPVKDYQEAIKTNFEMKDDDEEILDSRISSVIPKPLMDPILGKHFKYPERNDMKTPPVLDTTLSYIPVYSHLNIHECKEIKVPATPEVIRKTKERNFMEFYQPPPTPPK